jgi:hypothetical protein
MRKLHKKPEGLPTYRGVVWDARKGMWRCQIVVDYRYYCLGWCSSPYVAACYYDKYKMEAAEAGGLLQRKAVTNAALGLIEPLTSEILEFLEARAGIVGGILGKR